MGLIYVFQIALLLFVAGHVTSLHMRVTRVSRLSLRKSSLLMVESATESSPSPQKDPSKPARKGFGKPPPPKPVVEKDLGTRTYEQQAQRGVPEYSIFLRPVNGTDEEWLPVGSMTVPRTSSVDTAIFEVESELLQGTFKLYPKLRPLYEDKTRKEAQAAVFEYGYCLKAFPDEPIVRAGRPGDAKQQQGKGPGPLGFVTNWLSKITSPLDTSGVKKTASQISDQ
eukprot:gene26330-31807_t